MKNPRALICLVLVFAVGSVCCHPLDLLEAIDACSRVSACAFATRLNPGMIRALKSQNVRNSANAPENVGRLLEAAEAVLRASESKLNADSDDSNSTQQPRIVTQSEQVLALIEAAVMVEGPGALACSHRNERPAAIEPGVVRCVCLYGRDCSMTEEQLEMEALRSATAASDSASNLGLVIFILFAVVALFMLVKHIVDSVRMAGRGRSIDVGT